MSKLIDYLNALDVEARATFVAACGTSEGYMRKAVSSGQKLGPELCVRIEMASHKAVTRQDLRQDWCLIWPELRLASVNETRCPTAQGA